MVVVSAMDASVRPATCYPQDGLARPAQPRREVPVVFPNRSEDLICSTGHSDRRGSTAAKTSVHADNIDILESEPYAAILRRQTSIPRADHWIRRPTRYNDCSEDLSGQRYTRWKRPPQHAHRTRLIVVIRVRGR